MYVCKKNNVPYVKHEIIQRLCKMKSFFFLYENSETNIKFEVHSEELKKATVNSSLTLSYFTSYDTNINLCEILK